MDVVDERSRVVVPLFSQKPTTRRRVLSSKVEIHKYTPARRLGRKVHVVMRAVIRQRDTDGFSLSIVAG